MKLQFFKTIAIILLCMPASSLAIFLCDSSYPLMTTPIQTTPVTSYSSNHTTQSLALDENDDELEFPPDKETSESTQAEKDTELEALLSDTKILLLKIKNHELNDYVLVDHYFRNGNLLITKIPKSMRTNYKTALDKLSHIFHTTPNIVETIEEDSFNEDNEFLTAYNDFDYYLGECLFV